MNFLHPLFLLGLFSVAVPLILHLFGKRSTERVLFPPIEFLKRAVEARKRRSRWREWLLLAARIALLVALTSALARPFRSAETANSAGRRGLVVIDNTFSMAAAPEGRTLLDRAKEEARAIVSAGGPHDLFSVLSLVNHGDLPAYTNDRVRLDREVERVEQTFDTGSIFPVLSAALAEGDNPPVPPEVWFVTDGTDVPWRGSLGNSSAATVHVVDVTPGGRLRNASVTDLEWEDLSESGNPVLSLRVQVNGELPESGPTAVSVEWSDGREWKSVSRKFIGSESARAVDFEVPLPDRETAGRVRTEEDPFEYDDAAYFVASPRMRRRVAVVNGNPRPEPRNDAAFFVIKALKPDRADSGTDTFDLSEWSESDVSTSAFQRIDVLILADAGDFSPERKAALRDFVERGGGLIVGVGETFVEGRTPEALQGLLPARLRPAMTFAAGSELEIGPPEQAALFPMLSSRWVERFGKSRFRRIVASEPEASASVALKFSNGMPALVSAVRGKGRVLLFTSGLGGEWNDFGLNAGFPAWLRRTVVLAAEGGAGRKLNLTRARAGSAGRPGLVRLGEHDYRVLEGSREESDFAAVDRLAAEVAARPLKLDWSAKTFSGARGGTGLSRISEQSRPWTFAALAFLFLESLLAGRLPWRREAALLGVLPALVFALFPTASKALSDDPSIAIAELKLPIPSPYRNPLDPLLRKAREAANLDTPATVPALEISDRRLFDYPLLYLAGDRAFDIPSSAEVSRLRRHLSIGGMLFIDNATAMASGGFHESVVAFLKALFPDQPLSHVLRDHVVYQSYYLLDRLPGRLKKEGDLFSVDLKHRTAVFYFTGDLGGTMDPEIEAEEVRRIGALRFGVNLLMYALTLDYKRDQIHLPFILERRR